MSGRELVILLLGLAIVAVVLRGLFVAINARRGQIKLAIDKNIPQDVDLESLELAELPGGGARVVNRSLEEVNRQNNALDLAETKAKALNLTDADNDDHIPVLMDAVELSEPATARVNPTNEYQQEAEIVEAFGSEPAVEERVHDLADEYHAAEQDDHIEEEVEEEIDNDFIPQVSQEHSIGENWEEATAEEEAEEDCSELETEQNHEEGNSEDTDSVLFDYDEEDLEEGGDRGDVDAMSSVAPDYDDEPEEAVDGDASSAEIVDDDSYENYEESDLDDDLSERAEFNEQELAQEQYEEESPPAEFDVDSSADEFSMTAGERIGGNRNEDNQSGLFDDIDENEAEARDKPKARRTLSSLFGRKSKKREQLDGDQQSVPVTAEIEMAVPISDEPRDALLEEEHTQLDIEEIEHEEPAYEESFLDEEIIDELDQKRTTGVGHEPVKQDTRSEEFELSEVLVLNITAKDGRVFAGDDLLHALITAGLKFGDMNIFHKRLSKEHQGTIIFSVANMLNPGTFDLNNMDDFTTLGISFFLALPSPINNLDAFEQMLGVAQGIRDTLQGDLKDDHRNGMTGQTIEHYRQRVRDFELRRLKAVAARG